MSGVDMQETLYLRPKDLIQALQIPKTTLYRAIASGEIKSARLTSRGAIRIPASELDRLREQFTSLQER